MAASFLPFANQRSLVISAPPFQNSAMLGETQGRKKDASQCSGFGMYDLEIDSAIEIDLSFSPY